MSLDESIIDILRRLPPAEQLEALVFVKSLYEKTAIERTPRRSVKGLWSDFGFDVTEADIAEARSECWGNFPREDF